jgi:hypothetical protein
MRARARKELFPPNFPVPTCSFVGCPGWRFSHGVYAHAQDDNRVTRQCVTDGNVDKGS